MTWFIFSLSAVLALAVAELTQQHLLNKNNAITPKTSVVLTFLVQSLITIPFILFTPLRYEMFEMFDLNILFRVILVVLIGLFGNIFYFKSFQVKNISLSVIFISFSVIVSTSLGIVLFQESTSYIKLLGILLVLSAIVSLNYKNVILERNHYYGLIAGCMFGATYALDKAVVKDINPIIYIFWSFLLISILGGLFYFKEIVTSMRGKSRMYFKPLFLTGTCYFLYNYLTFNAYVFGGEVGRVDAINNFQVFLIVLFEYFVLKHTKGTYRKLLTALIAFIGVVLLGLY